MVRRLRCRRCHYAIYYVDMSAEQVPGQARFARGNGGRAHCGRRVLRGGSEECAPGFMLFPERLPALNFLLWQIIAQRREQTGSEKAGLIYNVRAEIVRRRRPRAADMI